VNESSTDAALYASGGQTWTELRVMGHADARGLMPYNEDPSRRRACGRAVSDVQACLPR
jgi:outer membrane protein OmpA-like peptidoglycan-associated protein